MTPWTAAHQAPPSMGFSRQEYWSGLPLPSLKDSWAPKNWCFWTVVLEMTLASLLDCKEIQPVHSKENQPWDFFGRNDAKAETPVLWPPNVKNWLIWKDPDAGKVWGQEEKGMTEDKMAGWHHRLHGHEFEWTLGVGDGQAMAPHSSTLAWKNPWTEEPGRLQSMGLQRVGYYWATSLSLILLLSPKFCLGKNVIWLESYNT